MENKEGGNNQMKSLEEISSAVQTVSQHVINTCVSTMASQVGQKGLHQDRKCAEEIM